MRGGDKTTCVSAINLPANNFARSRASFPTAVVTIKDSNEVFPGCLLQSAGHFHNYYLLY